jgi:hypothetical protein
MLSTYEVAIYEMLQEAINALARGSFMANRENFLFQRIQFPVSRSLIISNQILENALA